MVSYASLKSKLDCNGLDFLMAIAALRKTVTVTVTATVKGQLRRVLSYPLPTDLRPPTATIKCLTIKTIKCTDPRGRAVARRGGQRRL